MDILQEEKRKMYSGCKEGGHAERWRDRGEW